MREIEIRTEADLPGRIARAYKLYRPTHDTEEVDWKGIAISFVNSL